MAAKKATKTEKKTKNVTFSLLGKKYSVKDKTLTITFSVLVALLAIYLARSLFVAALVDRRPISRLAVVQELESRYGQEVLDSLINKALIINAAQRQNITVTKDEIAQEVSSIEELYTSETQTLDDLLEIQGMTRADLEEQIKVQLLIEKMLKDRVEVTDEEVDQYLEENKDFYDTENQSEEELKAQIREQLESQAFSQAFQSWVAEVKAEAKIINFVSY